MAPGRFCYINSNACLCKTMISHAKEVHVHSSIRHSIDLPVSDVGGSWAAASLLTDCRETSFPKIRSPLSDGLDNRLVTLEGCELQGKEASTI